MQSAGPACLDSASLKVESNPELVVMNTRSPCPVTSGHVCPFCRDQCLGKMEVPLSDAKIKAPNGPADIVKALSPTEGTGDAPVTGELRLLVELK